MQDGADGGLTIRRLIERQRMLANSANPAERLRVLWAAAALDQRLSQCLDHEIGRLIHIVQRRLHIFDPEMAVCEHAKRRLLRWDVRPRPRNWRVLLNEGAHLLNAEGALYEAGIPHLLLPFQRVRFFSNTFMVPDFMAAKACLLDAGFQTSRAGDEFLLDAKTGRLIRLYEHSI